jgi:hypothetical protein
MSFYDEASWVLIPEGIKEDVVYAQKPTNGLGDLTFTRASDATRTNSAGVIERTPWNLVTFSEDFSNAAWSKNTGGTSTVTVTANAGIAPNGTNTAERIQLTRDAAGFAQVTQTVGVLANQSYTFSVYLKSLSGTPRVMFGSFGGTNAQTAVLTNEWVRYTWTATAPSTSAFSMLMIWGGIASTSLSADFLAWGYQLVEGTDAKPYFATTNRQDVPRLDYRNADGTLNSCPRLLLEPQRTNSLRNSSAVGAVAGSPGTMPTNWAQDFGVGLTRTIVGIGTENGLPYIDFRFNGTAASASAIIGFETGTGITASTGQTWTGSFYAKTITSTPNTIRSIIIEYTAAGAYITDNTSIVTVSSTLNRVSQVRTIAAATTARIANGVLFNLTIGTAYDFTIRIAAPQMELGAYATTFIPTTTAAVTRLADAASKTGVSSLIGQTEGTFYTELQISQITTRTIFSLDIGTTTNYIASTTNATNQVRLQVAQAGSATTLITSTALTIGSHKLAFSYKSGDYALYIDGVQAGVSASTNFPIGTLSQIVLASVGYGQLNDGYTQAALFPTRLTNAQLAQLTT